MVNNAGPVELLQAALKASSLKQSTIANNIANANTPGYRRADVNFQAALAKALDSGSRDDLSNLKPEITRPGGLPVDANDNDVNMDMEVGDLIRNSERYKTCMRLLSNMYKQMQTAISDQI